MTRVLLVFVLTWLPVAPGCPGLDLPPDGEIVRSFAPIGRWAGHWGVDVAATSGSPVRAVGAGSVRFAGAIVDNVTVTIDHGGGIVTSYSYLVRVTVRRGDRVETGSIIGISGVHDENEAFHLSLRAQGRYVDPLTGPHCMLAPARGLYLVGGE